MAELTALVSRRGMLKGQITRILSYTQGERINIEINEIKIRKNRLGGLFDSFEEIQSSIEEETGLIEEGEKYRAEVEKMFYTTKNI